MKIKSIIRKLKRRFRDKLDGRVKFAIKTYFDGFYDDDIAEIPPIVTGLTTRDLGIHKIKVKSSKIELTSDLICFVKWHCMKRDSGSWSGGLDQVPLRLPWWMPVSTQFQGVPH